MNSVMLKEEDQDENGGPVGPVYFNDIPYKKGAWVTLKEAQAFAASLGIKEVEIA